MDGKHSGEYGYILRDQNDHVQEDVGQNQQDEEQSTIVELLNITSIFGAFQTERGESSNPNGFEQQYYVERLHVLVEEECRVEKAPHVINIV
jgi:hypothetical protein